MGALESRPRTVVLSLLVPGDSPAPSNKGPLGTSEVFRGLDYAGYTVVVAPQFSDLYRVSFEGRSVSLVIVGSDYFTERAADQALEALRYLSGPGGASRVYLVLLDEAPSGRAEALLLEAQRLLCGGVFFTLLEGESTVSTRLVVYSSDGESVEATTAIVAYASPSGPARGALIPSLASPLPPTSPPRPARVSMDDMDNLNLVVMAYAWPSPRDGAPVWLSSGIACISPRGGVVVLGDTSSVLNSNPQSLDVMLALLSWTDSDTVVTVQEAYISEELYRDVAVRVHPSVLLISLAQAYSEIEPAFLAALRSHPLLALGFAASMSVLLMVLFSGGRERFTTELKGARRENRTVLGAVLSWARRAARVLSRLQR